MTEMILWLRGVLDEDEATARAVAGHRRRPGELHWTQCDPERQPGLIGDALGGVVTYDEGSPRAEQAAHIARHDPASVLADIAAKRAILDALDAAEDRSMPAEAWVLAKQVVVLLASAYADRPGYREDWRP